MPTPLSFHEASVVIVTFNSNQSITPCLEALPHDMTVIVVDNASSDDTCDLVLKSRPDAVLIRNPKNEGYGRANNRGMAKVETRYGLILNPDARIDGEALNNLIETAGRNPNAAIVAPLLHRPKGGIELPLMGPGERNHRPTDVPPAGDFCTWFTTGAAMLCDMEAWKRVGGFDEAIFLYNEDADLALRINSAGYAQIVAPSAGAFHVGGGSVPNTLRIRWLKDWHMTWSHYYFEAKHGGDKAELLTEARNQVRKSYGQALVSLLLFKPKRVVGNLAKASAAKAYLQGKPSI